MCARALAAEGLDVVALDKARGAGGRSSTRRARTDAGEIRFDHGAQYFTIRDPAHAPLLDGWIRCGIVAPWKAFIGTLDRGRLGVEGRQRDGSATASTTTAPTRYVGTPGMSAIVQALQADLDVRFGCRVERIVEDVDGWRLTPADTGGDHDVLDEAFDAVVVTAPPAQAVALLKEVDPELARRTAQAHLDPCWAVMLQFSDSVRFAGPHAVEGAALESLGGLFVRNSPLSWVANQSSKPGRSAPHGNHDEHWVLHASPEWSHAHLEHDATEVGHQLVEAFAEATGHELPPILHQSTHRWRYASVATAGTEPFLWSRGGPGELGGLGGLGGLGVCGDWCVGGRVEGALTSGRQLAEHLLRTMG